MQSTAGAGAATPPVAPSTCVITVASAERIISSSDGHAMAVVDLASVAILALVTARD